MKWALKPMPIEGNERTIKRFLFLPLTLKLITKEGRNVLSKNQQGDLRTTNQTRWLETVTISQTYTLDESCRYYWDDIAFVD